ncbi:MULTISPECIES: STM4012 family radical SAM protein [unclassified Coleofasciculus]|uniref:STM4012 family radical SAM protein n=1 Tax=unclassified Coleofasciculus TaxID=2692782 RepID=UPI00187F75C9|nr:MULTISPECIES: STM4012 family radical SAM protein [unclassified Coleofasciculus]MBE9128466.1 STM4012 family radical SAM protein [Coleofasciculus sp. LEGE 07081]MBE9149275.1 STM4012 family radical SAM protein [Coleofasciculus sp. LEGE 07092]
MTHRPSLQEMLQKSSYQAYVYSYPHKTAYRSINPPISLEKLWSEENRKALFLYIHIPFCEMRCGFCNLFTTVKTDSDFVTQYINTVRRQANRVKSALGDATFARFAIGGGTPTQLPLHGLEAILDIAEETMEAKLQDIPISVEMSPETVDINKLTLLRDRGVDRASIGVQSFIDAEVLAIHRRQSASQVDTALTLMREAGFPTINIDLMYGLPGQTVDSWLQSIRAALRFQPEEIYLYPLYVRPLTGLGKSDREWDDSRIACYREGRSLLLSEGYTQVSMRMFRANHAPEASRPVYCCQADGMVGLGCGARSYTDSLHYSCHYAVSDQEVRHILEAFINTPDEAFDSANYGFQLDAEDRRRRYILLSLLSDEGLNQVNYCDRFGTDAFIDFPELSELIQLNLASLNNHTLVLTQAGIERSDTIGSWLFSDKVRQLMQAYNLK